MRCLKCILKLHDQGGIRNKHLLPKCEMNIKRKALKISKENWQISGNPYLVKGYGERKVVDITIGLEESLDGKRYILEDFFADMLDSVLDKTFTAHVDIYSEPMVVIEVNNQLVLHNPNISNYKQDVIEALDCNNVLISNQIRAVTDMRINMYSSERLSDTTKVLRTLLRESLGYNVNYELLNLVLRERYMNENELADTVLQSTMQEWSKEQLLECYGGIMEFKATGASRIFQIKTLLETECESGSITEIEQALNAEIAKRFFRSEIH